MSGGKARFGSLSVRDRLRAECEQRGIAYPLACDELTGSIVLCEQCPCLVTEERYREAMAAVNLLQNAADAAPAGVYLVSWNEWGFGCTRIGLVQ
jgi:hypothetical protein